MLIPVHILTGGLGSGKTTLLNDALRAGLGPDTAVIVNEFGEVALDQLFIQTRSADTVVLQNGCVCCTIRSDLAATLMQLLVLRPASKPFRRIVIETSGISDPLPILQTLRSDSGLAVRFRIGCVICTVPATDGGLVTRRVETLRQIAAADAIVITRRDLADREMALAAQAAAAALNPLACFLSRDSAELVHWLECWEQRDSDADRATPNWLQLPQSSKHQAHGVSSTVIHAPAPASWPHFAVWLSRLVFLHGDRILRTKGVLYDPGRDVWIGVHGVRRFFHPPVHLDLPTPPRCGACLIFITEDLDPARIQRAYQSLVAQQAEVPRPWRSEDPVRDGLLERPSVHLIV